MAFIHNTSRCNKHMDDFYRIKVVLSIRVARRPENLLKTKFSTQDAKDCHFIPLQEISLKVIRDHCTVK